MKRLTIALITLTVLIIALLPRPARAIDACTEPLPIEPAVGMKVIAELAGPDWGAAKVTGAITGYISVTYSDGSTGNLRPHEVAIHPDVAYKNALPPCFKEGDKVVAKVDGAIWRAGKVAAANGDKIDVLFADGSRKTLKALEIVRRPKRDWEK